ncbi:MAG: hypothetical protein GY830_08715 [Bacteroidetes bacterium]|nr:hypothetical protein [Bacteroidota bacterium]
MDLTAKRKLITKNEIICVGQQCDILNLPRSSYYYQEKATMLLIEDIYEDCPFYGGLRIYEELKESKVKVGGDKSTQRKDIEKAKMYWTDFLILENEVMKNDK